MNWTCLWHQDFYSLLAFVNGQSRLTIGHLRGDISIITVSCKSKSQAFRRFVSHLCINEETPRYGQAFTKKHPDTGRIVYDPKDIPVNKDAYASNADWKDFYGNVRDELPPKIPTPLGNLVTINAFVDANHAGNVVTHCSHTGIIIFVQNAPIIVYSNWQNTVEAATFGS
jgi:hypothetical protein